jgi:hypothetical protein
VSREFVVEAPIAPVTELLSVARSSLSWGEELILATNSRLADRGVPRRPSASVSRRRVGSPPCIRRGQIATDVSRSGDAAARDGRNRTAPVGRAFDGGRDGLRRGGVRAGRRKQENQQRKIVGPKHANLLDNDASHGLSRRPPSVATDRTSAAGSTRFEAARGVRHRQRWVGLEAGGNNVAHELAVVIRSESRARESSRPTQKSYKPPGASISSGLRRALWAAAICPRWEERNAHPCHAPGLPRARRVCGMTFALAMCRSSERFGAPNLEACMKYGLFWLLGVPIPVLIVVYLMFHH